MSKALLVGIISDDIEETAGYDSARKPVANEMNANPVFNRCYSTRCLEWFGVVRPTDEHLVPDNPA
eukprot:7123799-Heterocapsa_arctica.AAC.1